MKKSRSHSDVIFPLAIPAIKFKLCISAISHIGLNRTCLRIPPALAFPFVFFQSILIWSNVMYVVFVRIGNVKKYALISKDGDSCAVESPACATHFPAKAFAKAVCAALKGAVKRSYPEAVVGYECV